MSVILMNRVKALEERVAELEQRLDVAVRTWTAIGEPAEWPQERRKGKRKHEEAQAQG